MKTLKNAAKLLIVGALLTGSTAMAAGHFSVGVNIGVGAPYYYAPPPPPRVAYYSAPGPGYVWVDGYYAPVGRGWRWTAGYWTRPPYAGAYYVAPRYERGRYYAGRWDRHDNGRHNGFRR